MSTVTLADPLHLKTLSPTGTPPAARLKSAREAQDIYWLLKQAARMRLAKASIIQGMFDGNPPYNSAKMRNAAQAWRANFNTLEGAARLDAAKVPYYDLFSTAQQYADCNTAIDGISEAALGRTATGQPFPVDAASASRIRSEEFDNLLRAWPTFDTQIWAMLTDYIAFNRGFLWWPRPDSWQFECLPWHRVYFPDGTTTNPDKWELFAVEHVWPVHQLWGFISQGGAQAGWNRDIVIKAIRAAVPRTLAKRMDDPMMLQQAMRDSELYVSLMSSTVQAASIYVREFDGSWSRLMVTTEGEKRPVGGNEAMSPAEAANYQSGDDLTSKLTDSDWLYFKQNVGENIHQILCPFVLEGGSGSLNALEGLGKRIVSIMQLKDRMRNAQADNVLLRSNVLLQAQTGAAQSKSALITINGGVTVIPPGFAVQQATIFGDINATLEVNQDLDRMLDTNTGTYRPQFEKPQGNPESATAANIRYAQTTILTNSAVNRFYRSLDRFYTEMYRRIGVITLPSSSRDEGVRAAIEFRQTCKDRGLTAKQISDLTPGAITAVRTIGNGSPVMRQQVSQSIMGVFQYLGPRGQNAALADYLSAWAGQSAMKRLRPPEDISQTPTRDDWDATIENNDMKDGAPPMFAPWQAHIEHSKVHLMAGMAAAQSLQQGSSSQTVYTFLSVMLPHVIQHIQRVPIEPLVKQFEQAFKQLSTVLKQLEAELKKQAAQQQQQSLLTFEQQLAQQTAQADMQLKTVKQQHAMQLKDAKAQHDAALADQTAKLTEQRTRQEMTISDAKAASEITRTTATTAHDMSLAQTEAAHKQKLERQMAATKAATAAAKPPGGGK